MEWHGWIADGPPPDGRREALIRRGDATRMADMKPQQGWLPREVYAIRLESPRSYLVYAPLARCAFVTNGEGIDCLHRLMEHGESSPRTPQSMLSFLHSIGFCREREARVQASTCRRTFRPTAVSLFLTNACNLRCDYCYACGGEQPRRVMNEMIAKRAVDIVVNNALHGEDGCAAIAFHGSGEPSLNWHTLCRTASYARQRCSKTGIKLTLTAGTNGMLSERKAQWIAAHIDNLTVSFDGLPAVHDSQRPTVNGRGSSKTVMRTMHILENAGTRYGVRMTVTPRHLARLPDSMAFITENFSPESIQVEPVSPLGRWSDKPGVDSDQFIEMFRESAEIARDMKIPLEYSAMRQHVLTNRFCQTTDTLFGVTPEGDVTACYECTSRKDPFADTFFIGNIDPKSGTLTVDSTRLERLRSHCVDTLDYCRNCFARWHCAGDCLYKRFCTNGEGGQPGTTRCDITRALTKDRILDCIAQSPDGIAWRGHPMNADRTVLDISPGTTDDGSDTPR